MYPILREGDTCFISNEKPEYGDIICLRNVKTKEFVIHRLHDTDSMLTKGDNALYWDDPSEHILIGTVRKFKRNNLTSILQSQNRYTLLARYTTKSTPRFLRLAIKVLMRII